MAHRCDFCYVGKPEYVYDAKDFSIALGAITSGSSMPTGPKYSWSSIGAWAACADCSALIEAEDVEALARRALEEDGPFTGLFPPEIKEKYKKTLFVRLLSILFSIFMQERTGPRRPFVESPGEADAAQLA